MSPANESRPVDSHRLIGLVVAVQDQHASRAQSAALNEAGCSRILTAHARSGQSMTEVFDRLRPGDTLCVQQLEYLGCSARAIAEAAVKVAEQRASLRVFTGALAGTYTPTRKGKLFFTIMAALAAVDRASIRRRAIGELAQARASGRSGGRPTVMDPDKLAIAQARRTRGESPTQIARALGVSRATVYRHTSPPVHGSPQPADRANGHL